VLATCEYLVLCERQEKKKDAKGYEEYEDWEHKKGVPKELLLFIFRVRFREVELPLGTQSSHEVDLLVPSKHVNLHLEECS